MSILTKSVSITRDTNNIFTLSKTELAADALVAADTYFSDQNNWYRVVVTYKTSQGNQLKNVFFDTADTSPTGIFDPSLTARDDWEVQSLVIYDNDGGSFTLGRADLSTIDFDLTVTAVVAPVATTLVITQEPTNADTGTVISPAITVEIRDQFNALFSSTAQVDVAISSGTGTLSGDVDVAAVGGVATFSDLQIDSADSFTLEFTSAGLTSDTSASFTVTAPLTSELTWNEISPTAVFVTTPTSVERTDTGSNYGLIQSNEEVASGNIVFEYVPVFTPSVNHEDHIIGIDAGTFAAIDDVGYNDLDFGLHVTDEGAINVWESGAIVGTWAHATGDKFKIEVDGVTGAVTYWQDSTGTGSSYVLLHTSATTFSTYPARLSMFLRRQQSATEIYFNGEIPYWNTTGSSGTFVTTADSYERTDAGVVGAFIQSNQEFPSGDVRLEFTVGSDDTSHTIGLDGSPHVTGDGDEAFIDHGLRFASGTSYVVRIGGSQGWHNGSYIAGDVFKIEVVDGTVTYYKNGGVVYTHGATFSSYPIKLSSVVTGQGAKAYGITFDDQPVGPPWLFSSGTLTSFDTTLTSIAKKTGQPSNWTNNVLYNTELIGDASIEFTIDLGGANNVSKFMMIGFQDTAPTEISNGYINIKAGIYFNTTAGCMVVSGGTFDTNTGESWADNDTFKLEKIGSNLNFYKNGSVTPFYVHPISISINDPFKPSFCIYTTAIGVDDIIVTDL